MTTTIKELMNNNLPEIKSPYLQGYSDALNGRIILTAYHQDPDYQAGYDHATKDTQQMESTDDTAF